MVVSVSSTRGRSREPPGSTPSSEAYWKRSSLLVISTPSKPSLLRVYSCIFKPRTSAVGFLPSSGILSHGYSLGVGSVGSRLDFRKACREMDLGRPRLQFLSSKWEVSGISALFGSMDRWHGEQQRSKCEIGLLDYRYDRDEGKQQYGNRNRDFIE
ncbi:hypothetical protein LY76DRAFT_234853 [Colletotrichum caudatum]|nr:hypothetical protein LY76DRAFT_234853 [Colletotrichum caudatum]